MGYLTLLKYRLGASCRNSLRRLVRCEKGLETIEIVVLSALFVAILVGGAFLLKEPIIGAFKALADFIAGNTPDPNAKI